MTIREEAKTILHEKFSKPIMFGEVNNLIDKMCDDFESCTCENCNWYTFFNDYANSCSHSTNYITRGIPKDFGCNKFERKQDE